MPACYMCLHSARQGGTAPGPCKAYRTPPGIVHLQAGGHGVHLLTPGPWSEGLWTPWLCCLSKQAPVLLKGLQPT